MLVAAGEARQSVAASSEALQHSELPPSSSASHCDSALETRRGDPFNKSSTKQATLSCGAQQSGDERVFWLHAAEEPEAAAF